MAGAGQIADRPVSDRAGSASDLRNRERSYRDPKRALAASVTGREEADDRALGSRNWTERLPQGRSLGSCTSSAFPFRRANATSTSSMNSRIAVRFAPASALLSLKRATVSALPIARVGRA